MDGLAIKLAPIILIFGLGIVLKKMNAFSEEHAEVFLKLAFYVSLPASILLAIPKLKLTLDMVYIPISAIAVIIVSFVVSRIVGGIFELSKPAFGVFLISSMVMNIGFTMPFFIAAYGKEGFALVTLFDFGNALLVATFVYYIAVKYGSAQSSGSNILIKLLKSPILLSLFLGLVLNFTQTQLPKAVNETLVTLNYPLSPLLMLALGLSFTPSIVNTKALLSAIAIRMLFGLFLGAIFAYIFNLDGLNRLVVIICSSSPVGFSALTFSSLENLDTKLAASMVSFSVLIGVFSTTFLILFL